MQIRYDFYDPETLELIDSDIAGITFGKIPTTGMAELLNCLKVSITEGTDVLPDEDQLLLYLQRAGGLDVPNTARIYAFVGDTPPAQRVIGWKELTIHETAPLALEPGALRFGNFAVVDKDGELLDLPGDPASKQSQFIWLDLVVDGHQPGFTGNINFRAAALVAP